MSLNQIGSSVNFPKAQQNVNNNNSQLTSNISQIGSEDSYFNSNNTNNLNPDIKQAESFSLKLGARHTTIQGGGGSASGSSGSSSSGGTSKTSSAANNPDWNAVAKQVGDATNKVIDLIFSLKSTPDVEGLNIDTQMLADAQAHIDDWNTNESGRTETKLESYHQHGDAAIKHASDIGNAITQSNDLMEQAGIEVQAEVETATETEGMAETSVSTAAENVAATEVAGQESISRAEDVKDAAETADAEQEEAVENTEEQSDTAENEVQNATKHQQNVAKDYNNAKTEREKIESSKPSEPAPRNRSDYGSDQAAYERDVAADKAKYDNAVREWQAQLDKAKQKEEKAEQALEKAGLSKDDAVKIADDAQKAAESAKLNSKKTKEAVKSAANGITVAKTEAKQSLDSATDVQKKAITDLQTAQDNLDAVMDKKAKVEDQAQAVANRNAAASNFAAQLQTAGNTEKALSLAPDTAQTITPTAKADSTVSAVGQGGSGSGSSSGVGGGEGTSAGVGGGKGSVDYTSDIQAKTDKQAVYMKASKGGTVSTADSDQASKAVRQQTYQNIGKAASDIKRAEADNIEFTDENRSQMLAMLRSASIAHDGNANTDMRGVTAEGYSDQNMKDVAEYLSKNGYANDPIVKKFLH